MSKVAIYARYSSDNQREESITAQVRAAKEYCKRKGYTIVKIYTDEAKSGKSVTKREAFLQMVEDAKLKKFEKIIFHKIDRNARNEYDYYFYKNMLQKVGVGYEYVTQNIDSSPEGQMMETIFVGWSAFYSRNLSLEIQKGQKENALLAKFNGGTPPLGYDIVKQEYVINEKEAPAIRMIFDLYLKGYGYGHISKELNKAGHKTKAGKTFGKNSLYSILNNPRYCGTYTYGKVKASPTGTRNTHSQAQDMLEIKDAIPAIISKGEFESVQKNMKNNKRRGGMMKAKTVYLLSGMIYCGCGSAMNGKRTSVRGKAYEYYRCTTQERRGVLTCPNHVVDKETIETKVLQELNKEIFSPQASKKLGDIISEAYKKKNASYLSELANLNSQKDAAEKKLDRAFKRVVDEESDDEFDLEYLKKAKDEVRAIRAKLANLQPNDSYLNEEQVNEVIVHYKHLLETKKKPEEIRSLLNLFINKVTVSDEDVVITFQFKVCDAIGAGEGT